MSDTRSPALTLFYHVMEHEGHQMGRSNLRVDHSRRAAIQLAIAYGLRFDRDDFKVLMVPRGYGGGLYHPTEGDYALACGRERGVLNTSAVQAIEEAWGRKPFQIRDVYAKTPTRIYVGRRFPWHVGNVACTSFAKDQQSLTACTYKVDQDRPEGVAVGAVIRLGLGFDDGYRVIESVSKDGLRITLSKHRIPHDEVYNRKIDRRFTIDHAAIRAFHAASKRWRELSPRLALLLPEADRKAIIDRYGLTRGSVPTLKEIDEIEAAYPAAAAEEEGS